MASRFPPNAPHCNPKPGDAVVRAASCGADDRGFDQHFGPTIGGVEGTTMAAMFGVNIAMLPDEHTEFWEYLATSGAIWARKPPFRFFS
jgi:hypothetical protein